MHFPSHGCSDLGGSFLCRVLADHWLDKWLSDPASAGRLLHRKLTSYAHFTCHHQLYGEYFHTTQLKIPLQAFGARRYAAMGIIAQRAALICLIFSALIILAWTQLERLLLLLGEH